MSTQDNSAAPVDERAALIAMFDSLVGIAEGEAFDGGEADRRREDFRALLDRLAAPQPVVKESLTTQEAEAFVRSLLWGMHPECCGQPDFTDHGIYGTEQHCCGQPNHDTLNDTQIVASLRERFPDAGHIEGTKS